MIWAMDNKSSQTGSIIFLIPKKNMCRKNFLLCPTRKPFEKSTSFSQQKLDEILDKINEHGYHFLTDEEKEFLKKASKENLIKPGSNFLFYMKNFLKVCVDYIFCIILSNIFVVSCFSAFISPFPFLICLFAMVFPYFF